MTRVTCQITMSADGFVAGPDQSLDEPLGVGGEALHHWMFQSAEEVDRALADSMLDGVGAYIMGRNMFGGGHGPWSGDWRGWWGDDPPYHCPVFVLTHHPRDPVEMDGGTTFFFVTDGIEAALASAREAAGDRDVMIAGGASCVNQYLAAGVIDELVLHIAPVVLGDGARLFAGVGPDVRLEVLATSGSAAATHITYRVGG